MYSVIFNLSVKGALDKYNIYLFESCSRENFTINQYKKFQPIQPVRFHFIWKATVLCIYWNQLLKKKKK